MNDSYGVDLAVTMHIRGAEIIALSDRLLHSFDAEKSARIVSEAKNKLADISKKIEDFDRSAVASFPETQP